MYKLMIVDDEWIERSALRAIVEDNFKEIEIIEEAANGVEAINKAKEICPDIVLMDIDMPAMDGMEASRIIKEELSKCKLIFLTAYGTFEYAKQAIKIGVKDYLIKPARDEEIVDIISQTLESIKWERAELVELTQLQKNIKQYKEWFGEQLIGSVIQENAEVIDIEGILEKQKELYSGLVSNDSKASINIIVVFIDELEKRNIPFTNIKEIMYKLISMLGQSIYLNFNVHFIDEVKLEEEMKIIKSSFGLMIYIKTVLGNLLNEMENVKSDKAGKLVQDIEEYIEDNYMRELSLQELAKAMNFSTFYFSKLFKQYFNKNFIDYIIDIRLEKAKEMMKNPELTVKEIGINIGYGDPNYFTKIFRKKVGKTPTEYRNCIKNYK